MVDVLVRDGYALVQPFVDGAEEGDARLILLDGKLLEIDGRAAAVRRIPGGGDFRSNVHAGGTPALCQLTAAMRELAEQVGPLLAEDGLFLAGLDVIGSVVVEVNAGPPAACTMPSGSPASTSSAPSSGRSRRSRGVQPRPRPRRTVDELRHERAARPGALAGRRAAGPDRPATGLNGRRRPRPPDPGAGPGRERAPPRAGGRPDGGPPRQRAQRHPGAAPAVLAHLFPGREDGNVSELYAYRVVQRLVRRFDYLLDLHTASFGRVNSLYVRADLDDEQTSRIARLLRPEILLLNPASDGTLRGAAMELGIPAVTLEIGNPQRFQEQYVRASLVGIRRVICDLGLLPKRKVARGPEPVVCRSSGWLYNSSGGLLTVLPDVTDRVEGGEASPS